MGFRTAFLALPRAARLLAALALSAPGCSPLGVSPATGGGRARVSGATELKDLPSVAVMDIERRAVSLKDVLKGRPALVSLWATWCDACEEEIDALNRLQEKVGAQALVVGVAVGEPYEHVVAFLKTRRLSYPQLIDEEFVLSDALGSSRVPHIFVVDRNGSVRHTGGRLDSPTLHALRQVIDS